MPKKGIIFIPTSEERVYHSDCTRAPSRSRNKGLNTPRLCRGNERDLASTKRLQGLPCGLIPFIGVLGIIFSLSAALVPKALFAQSDTVLVPCGTESSGGKVSNPCGFSHLVKLAGNIANYLIILGAAFSALAFGWAGFLMMTAGGETAKIDQAKAIFAKVLVGFIIMLSAWLMVKAIELGLVKNTEFRSLLG